MTDENEVAMSLGASLVLQHVEDQKTITGLEAEIATLRSSLAAAEKERDDALERSADRNAVLVNLIEKERLLAAAREGEGVEIATLRSSLAAAEKERDDALERLSVARALREREERKADAALAAAREREERIFPPPSPQEQDMGWSFSYAHLKRLADFSADDDPVSMEDVDVVLRGLRAALAAPAEPTSKLVMETATHAEWPERQPEPAESEEPAAPAVDAGDRSADETGTSGGSPQDCGFTETSDEV